MRGAQHARPAGGDDADAKLPDVAPGSTDLLTGEDVAGFVVVPAGGARVLRTPH